MLPPLPFLQKSIHVGNLLPHPYHSLTHTSAPCIRSRGTLASLDHAKWACLDAALSVVDAANGPATAACIAPGGVGGEAVRHPVMSSLIRPELCRRLLAEALDVLQYCLEDETVVVLRCLRRCWIQIMGAGPQEQVCCTACPLEDKG